MNSSFTWFDYSEYERRRMLDVTELFGDPGARDELGLGTIRDALADTLFPGTNNMQTRARYLLFVPWVYKGLERRAVPSSSIERQARREELYLLERLADSGARADARPKRLPSDIYWRGLGSWGIRLFRGPRDQYHLSLGAPHFSANDAATGPQNWHPGLPPPPEGFPEGASFDLTATEADYLRGRILTHVPASLLAFLLEDGAVAGPTDFCWEHPALQRAPAALREQVEHARNFSEAMHGPALVYNLMLAEEGGRDDVVASYMGSLAEWAALVDERAAPLRRWDRGRFRELVISANPRLPMSVLVFVEGWLDLLLTDGPTLRAATGAEAREMIRARERQLKRSLSRLGSPLTSSSASWGVGAGTARLSYRWPVARGIINDILHPLSEAEAAC